MHIARTPNDEPKRLAALYKLKILDTPIEERFERITRMVCRLLDVPISVFTLIDDRRQWFKSATGLRVSETSRDVAFCAHTICGNGPLVVEDARKDARFFLNPLVTGAPHIVFYAGYPVRSTDGQQIGSICAIDRNPRQMSLAQIHLLQDMAAMIETELRTITLCALHSEIMNECEEPLRHSLIDPVTRLWNHAGACEFLQREWHESARSGSSIGLIIAEIDQFDRIQKNCGQAVADSVLENVAKRMLSTQRPNDALTRFSDKGFLHILPGCGLEHLALMADRPLKAVRKSTVLTEKGEIPVSVSIGAVVMPGGMRVFVDQALAVLNKALDRALQAGGNRVEIGILPQNRT